MTDPQHAGTATPLDSTPLDSAAAEPPAESQGASAQEDELQDVYADYGVARAFSLAASILDAGSGGLTKTEIRERVEHYRSFGQGQSEDAWERLFSRDKDHLRGCGIAIAEPAADRDDYRYRIDPDDYGLPALQLTDAESLVLTRASQLWSGSRTRSWLEQASWALSTESAASLRSEDQAGALSFNLGSDDEFDRLTELAAFDAGTVVGFDYSARGAAQPAPRRVVLLDYAARGHWYLIGHDLDRDARRVFRLDRVHGPISTLTPQPRLTEEQRSAVAGADARAALEAFTGAEDPAELLRGVLDAHGSPAPPLPRLAPAAPARQADPAHRKVERVLSIAAYLLSSPGARPSELLRRHQITPKQLLKDLLSIQQSGSFGPEQYGEFIDVDPAPPLNLAQFTEEYLPADEPITLAMPSARTGDVLARPLTLTKPGALSLLIALNTMIGEAEAALDLWLPAAVSLREKITTVLPDGLQRAATQVAAGAQAQTQEVSALREAARSGTCLELVYEDAEGTRTRRIVEPAQVYIDGPRVYLQAWCRLAQAPRNFLSSRILEHTALPEEPIGEQARALAQTPMEPPRPPRGAGGLDVVLRFSPAAAGLADRYAPQRQRTHTDGARSISTWFQSREALIRLCLQAGGDMAVLAPAELRREVHDRARTQLSEHEG
ncbi:helix-turn-helix transcriptional regulator [Nesterenkonia halotolerans]|uniref:DNA-binding transcriptional regulator YafY n=1 Tax=Nesterenkonia halotolerans TaxID=225325 RepID=A0ABR9J499_9MICC|nr:WYL domain-containing protein [Nesterenkonia halotolerans]MBE1513813.1 putative DNA-binding transcriptional regulator YafY [Nesterenkonia halotolerans]